MNTTVPRAATTHAGEIAPNHSASCTSPSLLVVVALGEDESVAELYLQQTCVHSVACIPITLREKTVLQELSTAEERKEMLKGLTHM